MIGAPTKINAIRFERVTRIMTLARSAAGRLLPEKVLHQWRWARARWRARAFARKQSRAPRPHNLPAPLYVSLTSHPARFGMLPHTLRSLLRQSVRPDGILLWIAHEDMPRLPRKVARLASRGVIIRECEDLRSYKKLVFALAEFPDAFIVTADDDLYYPPTWLETLVDAVDRAEKTILCHRAHRIAFNEDGSVAPYDSWQWDVQDEAARRPSRDLVPTTGAGALYPPRCLSDEVGDADLFQRLCPTADDFWFYAMARRAGTPVMKVGGRFAVVPWPGARASSLWAINQAGANDRQIRNLEEAFGKSVSFG